MDSEQRANRAKDILDDPMVADALQRLEANFVNQWAGSRSARRREELWHGLKGLRAFRAQFEAIIVDGELAKSRR